MSAAAATESSAAPYAQIGDGLRHKKESEPNILLLPRARIGRLPHHPSSEPVFPTSGATRGSGGLQSRASDNFSIGSYAAFRACRDGGAMNSGPTGWRIFSRRMASIAAKSLFFNDQP